MAKAENHPKPKKRAKKSVKLVDVTEGLSPMNLNAAGIAVGSGEHYVAVPIGRDPHPVQKFGSFTAELYRMVKWLLNWGVKSVGMPASGVYWIGLYPILEEHGLEVRVTNARYTQRLPGGKSDVQECQGLQKRHPFGLLPRCFRPIRRIPRAALLPAATREPGGWHRHLHATHPESSAGDESAADQRPPRHPRQERHSDLARDRSRRA
jgi:hypothetical protein